MNLKHTTHLTLLTLIVAISGASLAYAESATVDNAQGSSRAGCEADNSCFSPYTIEINVGDTVTWTNPDTTSHTVVSGFDRNDPDFSILFNSWLIYPDGEFTHQFDEAGTFPYTCELHPWMKGVVVVADEEAMTDDDSMMMGAPLTGTVTIGALHPLSGDLGGMGGDVNLATQLAVEDFNEYLQSIGAEWTLEISVEDTRTSPPEALNAIQALHSKAIDMVVGPATSGNTQQVKGYADENGMLVVSCCSTAPSLAIAGDSVYRMVPDDTNQGAALAKLLEVREMAALVPMWRADPYGEGLRSSTVNNFVANGGVAGEGVRYVAETPEFGLEVASLADQVQDMVDEYGADKVAILLISFEESIQIIQAAAGHDVLSEVSWFVSEAVVDDLDLDDPIVHEFVESTDFVGTTILISKGDKAQSLQDRMSEILGEEPSVFSYPAYDAVWILGKAVEYVNSDDTAMVKKVIQQVAADYNGAMQSTALNENGDLIYANYQIKTASGDTWEDVRKYLTQYDLITAVNQPTGEIEVGSLYPLTGSSSATGYATREATDLGAADFNKLLQSIGEEWHLTVISEDSTSLPTIALEKTQTLFARGIDIIIGPRPSGEVAQVKQYADINDMMIISCCSTAPRLSIPDDSIYRLVPDDANQGRALAKLFETEGIEAIVPIIRADAYGVGLQNATATEFMNLGYEVATVIEFDPFTAITPGLLAAELNDNAQDMVDKYGTDKVAVLITAFDESVQIIEAASEYDLLSEVRWFGAETFTSKTDILNNAITNELVTTTSFTSLAFAATTTSETEEYIRSYFLAEHGEVPTQYVRNAYDIPWLVGLSILHSGATDAGTVKSVFHDVAANYEGAVGKAVLNEAGDLTPGDYSIWTVTDDGWVEIGKYSPSNKAVTYYADMSGSN